MQVIIFDAKPNVNEAWSRNVETQWLDTHLRLYVDDTTCLTLHLIKYVFFAVGHILHNSDETRL